MFSVVEGVLLRPLPYPDDGRIVRVGATTYSSSGQREHRSRDRGYWHFVNNNRSFEKFGAYRVVDSASADRRWSSALGRAKQDDAERVRGARRVPRAGPAAHAGRRCSGRRTCRTGRVTISG